MIFLFYQVAYDDFVAVGSLAAAREKGLVSWFLYYEHLFPTWIFSLGTFTCCNRTGNPILMLEQYLHKRVYI